MGTSTATPTSISSPVQATQTFTTTATAMPTMPTYTVTPMPTIPTFSPTVQPTTDPSTPTPEPPIPSYSPTIEPTTDPSTPTPEPPIPSYSPSPVATLPPFTATALPTSSASPASSSTVSTATPLPTYSGTPQSPSSSGIPTSSLPSSRFSPQSIAVTWVDQRNVTAINPYFLAKTVGANAWDAGASSAADILPGAGYAETTITSISTGVMFGLSTQDVSVGYSTINYAWFTRNDIGQLEIYENGTFRGDFGVYGVGDILRVSVDANGVIHYYHNGIQVPISSGAATFPLSVDTSFYTPGAQIQNTVLYADNLGPVPLPTLTPQSVNWVDQRNVNVKGTSLTKSSQAGTDWNAGAVSASNQFILSGAGYVEFSAPTTSDSFMVGLSSRDTDVGFATINYAWFVRADTGILEIYENGTWKGYYGVYGTFSVLRVQVDPSGTVSYYHNGRLMHTTSGITLSYPLMVDVSMWTPSGQIVNTTIGGVSIGSVPSPYPPGQPIGWVDQRNVTVNLITNSIVKNINSTNWDAGAASSQAILPGAGYMEATVADISTSVMFGLSTQDLSTGFSTINYAWFTRSDTGQLEIYENGTFRGDFGLYDPGDVLRIALKSNGKVTYYHNGVSIFASSTIATFPLSVDTSIYSTNGQIKNVMLYAANLGPVPLPTLTPQSVNWVDRRNVSVANNTLTKDTSAGADWNAGAVSASNQFILSGVGYVEFTAPAITHSFMVGLSSRDTDVGFASINYAWFVRADTGTLEVYENGVFKGSYGVYGAGSVLRVQADPSGVVSYYHNGRLLRTSTGANLTYPLMVDVSMWTPGGQILNTTLGGENLGPVPSPYPPGQPVSWVDQRNVTVTPTVNSILKNAGGSSWNAGAASTQDILSGIGYVDMTLGPLQHEALFGLSTQDVDLCWCTVSYGWHTRTDNGQLEIYENGAWQGSFGLYDPGDVLRVAVDANGTVTYYHNGVLARTSNRVATFPLLVDTAIKDQGTQLLNVMLYAASGGPPPAPSPSPVAVWWIDPANVAAVSNTLTKTSAGFWDGGAASNTSIKSGAGYIQATIASTADEIMLGMSSEDRDICWCTIQYGWHTRPDLGLLEIYENGIRLPGFYGEYGAGSVLRVQVDANGIVSYYHNNWLVYISAVSATYPLLLDTSLNTFNATLQDAVMSGANLVLNTKQFGSLASGDYVAWSTLSIPLVDGQLPQQNVNVVNPATHRLMSITGSPGYQTAPAVSGNMMVWEDNSHSCATCERDVLGEDLSTGYTFPVATGPVDQVSPAINGSLVVWVEATDNGSSIWQKEIPSGQPELVASIAADQIVSVPVVSSSYIVWSEKPSNGAIGNTIVIHSYDRATGVVNTAVRSDEMNTEFAIFDYRLVLANNQGISVTDLNTDQTSVVSSIGGFSPTIQGTQVMWVSGSSPNPDVNNFDIWYLDLANPANGPIALVTDPQSQFNPAVSGTRFAYTDSFPFVLGGDQRIYATERFGNIVVGDLPTALQAVRQNASQKLSVMPTPRPTVIAPSGKAASTGSDAPATTARISKGVDAANGDGWGFNPAAAVDVLGPSPDEGYFGAVLVLSSDLPAVVMPTNP
ncbi:MAG: hypothetical protein IVW55_03620, partial [Chloroflexi bacterium]|nr:hypothetical protein [Chloroflexota bacterium]